MNAVGSVALRIDRHDGAYGFDDPAVPGDLTIERLTQLAAPRVRYPLVDVSSGKGITYALLHDGREVPRETTVARAFPERRAKCTLVHQYQNA
jgi:hypothetical protein